MTNGTLSKQTKVTTTVGFLILVVGFIVTIAVATAIQQFRVDANARGIEVNQSDITETRLTDKELLEALNTLVTDTAVILTKVEAIEKAISN